MLARAVLPVLAFAALAAPAGAVGVPSVPNPLSPAARDTDPVVLTGASFGSWAVPANTTAKAPGADLACQSNEYLGTSLSCDDPHNHYANPDVDTGGAQNAALGEGTPVDRLLGYRWNGRKFVQIPFQVDQVFTRYLDNSASGFAIYSGQDQHTTYQFDREGFRYTKSDPANPCHAIAASPTAKDPISGLDTNDELSFMARDAGAMAPAGTSLPKGILDAKVVRLLDPSRQNVDGYVYVMRAAADGPRPAFNASNGYVHYQRNADADTFALSQSSYSDYGNAATGPYCDDSGHVIGEGRRRPRDTATITTPRYRFLYQGRWLMTNIQIKKDGARTYGPNLVDRWKARAFAQDPGSDTPCCGYEEEDTNWGGSSTLMGERVGPVRAIRETWGADSGTNVVREETFYRDTMAQRTWLRVHVIPPLDGIYAQWDFRAGRVDRFYNDHNPQGVPIDGQNDEMFGNYDDPCNSNYDGNSTSQFDQEYRSLYRQIQLCKLSPYHQSVDVTDPTFNAANAELSWSETAGPYGTIVDRIYAKPTDLTPGGAAQSIAAVPYYRDDSCFDDGTGSDPGPKLHLRSGDEPKTAADGTPRKCWTPADGDPNGSDHYYQGSIGTHGLHLLFQADSDNARLQEPIDEIVSNWQLAFLPGRPADPAATGEAYGRVLEKPLVPVVTNVN